MSGARRLAAYAYRSAQMRRAAQIPHAVVLRRLSCWLFSLLQRFGCLEHALERRETARTQVTKPGKDGAEALLGGITPLVRVYCGHEILKWNLTRTVTIRGPEKLSQFAARNV